MKKFLTILWTMLTWGDGIHGWTVTLKNRNDCEYDRAVSKIYRKSRHSKRIRIIEIRDILED